MIKTFIFGFNAFKQGYAKNKLLHTELCLICSIFDTYGEKYDKEYIYIYDIFINLLKEQQQRNRLSKMMLEYLDEDIN